MSLPDTNIWLALALSAHPFHALAHDWFAAQNAPAPVLFCRATQQSFVRLVTTDKVMRPYAVPPLTNVAAWNLYQHLLADRRVAFAVEPPNIEQQWHRFVARPTASPKLWMDAYLAAFAVAGKHQLVTTDHAFAQFGGLNHLILGAAP